MIPVKKKTQEQKNRDLKDSCRNYLPLAAVQGGGLCFGDVAAVQWTRRLRAVVFWGGRGGALMVWSEER